MHSSFLILSLRRLFSLFSSLFSVLLLHLLEPSELPEKFPFLFLCERELFIIFEQEDRRLFRGESPRRSNGDPSYISMYDLNKNKQCRAGEECSSFSFTENVSCYNNFNDS